MEIPSALQTVCHACYISGSSSPDEVLAVTLHYHQTSLIVHGYLYATLSATPYPCKERPSLL